MVISIDLFLILLILLYIYWKLYTEQQSRRDLIVYTTSTSVYVHWGRPSARVFTAHAEGQWFDSRLEIHVVSSTKEHAVESIII